MRPNIYSESDVILANFEKHYVNSCKIKNIDMFEAGRNYSLMVNMFLNPFILGTKELEPAALVLFDILDLKGYQDLVLLREKLKEQYEALGLIKITSSVHLNDGFECTTYYLKEPTL